MPEAKPEGLTKDQRMVAHLLLLLSSPLSGADERREASRALARMLLPNPRERQAPDSTGN